MSTRIKSTTEIDPKIEEKRVINELKSKLREGKEIINCEPDEIAYIKKPVGKSIYTLAMEAKQIKRKKWDPHEKIICSLCGKEYTRANKAHHVKTKYHITYKIVNDKLTRLILN